MGRAALVGGTLLRSCLIAGLLAVSSVTVAHAEPTPSEQVATAVIEVRLVRAGHDGDKIDPRLKDVVRDLRSLPYTSFEQMGSDRADGVADVVAELSNGVKAEVRIVERQGDHVSMAVKLYRDGKLLTTTTLKRPIGRAGVVSVGRDGSHMWVVTIRARH